MQIRRGEAKRSILTFTDASGQLAPVTDLKIEVRFIGSGAEFTKANTAAGGGDDEIEDVSVGKVRLKLPTTDTSQLEPGLLTGEVWITDTDEEPRRIGLFRAHVV